VVTNYISRVNENFSAFKGGSTEQKMIRAPALEKVSILKMVVVSVMLQYNVKVKSVFTKPFQHIIN